MEEEWRDIKGFPGYQVSNLGRVRSFKKAPTWEVTNYDEKEAHILKPRLCHKKLYYRVVLSKGHRQLKSFNVHRLVAEAFVPHPGMDTTIYKQCATMPTVNHINRNTRDNRAENLEWMTLSENVKTAFKMGFGTERPCKLQTESGEILDFKSQAEASRYLRQRRRYIDYYLRRHKYSVRDIDGTPYKIVQYTERTKDGSYTRTV